MHHGEFVHLDELPNGNLRVTLTLKGRREALENRHPQASDDDVFSDLYTGDDSQYRPDANGGALFMPDIQYLDGTHLSNAPCLVTDWDLNADEDGHRLEGVPEWVSYVRTDSSKLWYWGDYQIVSILETCLKHGEAVLTLLR